VPVPNDPTQKIMCGTMLEIYQSGVGFWWVLMKKLYKKMVGRQILHVFWQGITRFHDSSIGQLSFYLQALVA